MKVPTKLVENISIHGIRYIFLGHVNRYARVFWSVVVLSSIGGLLFNNYLLYQKLNEIPDISIRTSQMFTNEIPFPAITVCTSLFAKSHLGQYFNATKSVRSDSKANLNLSIEDQNYLASNIHACHPESAGSLRSNVMNRTNNNVVQLLNKSSLILPEVLLNCAYQSIVLDCSYIFNRVLTDRGYCYSFNLQGFNTIFNEKIISEDFYSYKRYNIRKSMFAFNPLINEKLDDMNEVFQWSLDHSYAKDHDADSVPVNAEKGKFFSFNIHLNESDTSNICMQIGNIFSFYIHLPTMPMHQEHYVEFKRKRDIVLSAKAYKVDEGMKKFPPKIRGCYFEDEKRLKFFKTYTKALCEYECMTNYTLSECGCVKFSMPRVENTPVCTIDDVGCYLKAMKKWPDYGKVNDRFEATCGCLKTCNNIKYEVKFDKISTSENVMFIYDVYNLSKTDPMSRVQFVFDDFEIVVYEEYASYKLQNFVADVGGLLGFFLGCSILSLIEIGYFIVEAFSSKIKDISNRKTKKRSIMKTEHIKAVRPIQTISHKNLQSYVNFYN